MRAASIDAEGYARWRGQAGRATVHSVFDRVINLQAEAGGLFAVAAAGLDDAPDTLVSEGPLAAVAVAPGDPVQATAERLVIGTTLEFALAGARPWRAVLPPYPARPQRLRRNLEVVRAALAQRRPPGTCRSALDRELVRLLDDRRDLLCAALAAGDRAAAVRHGQAMLGLGPGLTPSGDDFLAGLLVVLHLPRSPGASLRDVGPPMVAGAERRTNAISIAMLRAAAQGRVHQRVIVLLRELVAGDARSTATALAPVLAIGSTSGSDMAAGIVAGLDVQLQMAPEPQAEPSLAA